MIDKLELRAPQLTEFRAVIIEAMREIDWERGSRRVGRSQHYAGVLDLRPFGADALLHAYNKHRTPRDHKLELLDTGKKTYGQLVDHIERVFAIDPTKLPVMRVDLCADVSGVPVSWFQPRVHFKFKQFGGEIGEMKYGQMGSRKIETIVAGKRPNLFRIYDKTTECMVDFRKRVRKASKDADCLDFAAEYGFSPDAVLTRVERQLGGGKVPALLSTFGKLSHNAADFNPFLPIQIVSGESHIVPTLEQCPLLEWLVGTRINELAREWGMQQLRRIINRKSKGNAARFLEHYGRFLPSDGLPTLTSETLFELYRKSVTAQLSH